MDSVGEVRQQHCHRIYTQQVLSRLWDGVNIHVVTVRWEFIPRLPMGSQEMLLRELRDGKPGCGKKSSGFRKRQERLFLEPQPIAVVGSWGSAPEEAFAVPQHDAVRVCACRNSRAGFSHGSGEQLRGVCGSGAGRAWYISWLPG